MGKPGKRAVRARKVDSRDDDSLLIQSAESIGRVLGSLRQQVFGAVKPAAPRARATPRPASTARKARSTAASTVSRKTTTARKAAKKR